MRRFLPTLVAAAALSGALATTALAADRVVVIDAPDVQKINATVGGLRMSEVMGADVYGNAGKRIGELEDFTIANGFLYAVIDIQDGPIEQYVDITDDDLIVVPWNQLRMMDRPDS